MSIKGLYAGDSGDEISGISSYEIFPGGWGVSPCAQARGSDNGCDEEKLNWGDGL